VAAPVLLPAIALLAAYAGARPDGPKELATLRWHGGPVLAVAFSPDGKTLAAAAGWYDPETNAQRTDMKLWDVATRRARAVPHGHAHWVHALAFSPDGKTLASASYDRTLKLWEGATGKERRTLGGHTDYVYSVAFSPDGRTLASGAGDGTVRLWEVVTGRERVRIRAHDGYVAGYVPCVRFTGDGKGLVAGVGDRTVRLWDAV